MLAPQASIKKGFEDNAEPSTQPSRISPRWHDDSIPRWSRRTVEALLRRPTYAGLVQSGSGSRARYGKALGVVVAEGTHEPIIDRGTWQAVQDALDGFRVPSARRGSWHWLAGRVFCAACGARLYFVDAQRTKRNETPEGASSGGQLSPARRMYQDSQPLGPVIVAAPASTLPPGDQPRQEATSLPHWPDRYWRCRNSYARTFGRENDACPATKQRISDRMLTHIVVDALYCVLRNDLTWDDARRAYDARQGAQAITARETAERQLAELQAQRMAINDAIQMRIGDLSDLAQRDRAIVASMDRVTAQLAALPAPVTDDALMGMVETMARVRAEIPTMTPEQWAPVATELGLRVTVDLDTQTVTLGYRHPYGVVFG